MPPQSASDSLTLPAVYEALALAEAIEAYVERRLSSVLAGETSRAAQHDTRPDPWALILGAEAAIGVEERLTTRATGAPDSPELHAVGVGTSEASLFDLAGAPGGDELAPEPIGAEDVLDDLADLLDSMPTVWWDGSERDFMVHAWSALDRAGVVPRGTAREHVRAVATLAALHLLRVTFYTHSHDESDPTLWGLDDLEGPYPRLDQYLLGLEAGASQPKLDVDLDVLRDEDLGEEIHQVWTALVRERYEVVTTTLLEVWGENELFCALWASAASAATFPVPGDVASEILNDGGSLAGLADRMPAWEWLTGGMEPYMESDSDW